MFVSSKKIMLLISSIKTLSSTIDKIDRAVSRSEKDNEFLLMELEKANIKIKENNLALSRVRSNLGKLGISYDFISQASDAEMDVSKILVEIRVNKDGLKNPFFSNDLQRKSAISLIRKLMGKP